MRAFRYGPLLFSAFVLLAVACDSGPAEVGRARKVLAERTAEDPAHHLHAVSIMGGSTASHARETIAVAIAGPHRVAATEAIRGLTGPTDEATEAALRTAFGTGGSVKMAAAARLAASGDAEALEWLAGELGRAGQVLPGEAMAALATTEHSERVREALRGLIWNKSISIRNEGYVLLGQVSAPWAVSVLLEGLDKEFGEERLEPIVGLGRTGDPSAAEAIHPWVNTQGLVLASLEALRRLGNPDSLEVVAPMLDHEQGIVRAYAAAAAWSLGDREGAMASIPALISADDVASRRALAEQLAGSGEEEVIAWLSQLAQDGDKSVRAEAYRSLIPALPGPDPALATLFAAGAQDPDYEVSTVALSGLALTGDSSQTAALAPLLESDNPYLAISAAHAVLCLAGSQA